MSHIDPMFDPENSIPEEQAMSLSEAVEEVFNEDEGEARQAVDREIMEAIGFPRY
jgi:hypothetical protein